MKLIRYRTTLCILIFATHAQANSHLAKPPVNQLPTPTTDQNQDSHLDLQEIFNNKHIQESAILNFNITLYEVNNHTSFLAQPLS